MKKYKKNIGFTYVYGAFASYEWMKNRSIAVNKLIISEKFNEIDKFVDLANKKNIDYLISEKAINKLMNSNTHNAYVILQLNTDEIKKFSIDRDAKYIVVLHEISDMGNLGNILRSSIAFGIRDVVTIGNTCDYFNPKVLRASMGASSLINHTHYDNFDDYYNDIGKYRTNYMFVLNEYSEFLDNSLVNKDTNYSFVFGNEGSGIPKEVYEKGISIKIKQSEFVDSLNLTTAVAVALYELKGKNL